MNKSRDPPYRLLLGPGPSNIDKRVFKALTSNLVGYLDPFFMEIMDEVQELLKYVFQTTNDITLPISGTGMAGMEAAFCNIINEGDEVVVGVNGFFGERMCDVITRLGGNVVRVEKQWGKVVEKDEVEKALSQSQAKAVALVHGETSTGVLQPLKEIGRIIKSYDALFIVDAVTSLSGCELYLDDWDIDICYSGTQKCLNCPPGLSPISFSDRAWDVVQNKQTRTSTFYLDISQIWKYWTKERIYHHTPPILMIYALCEALKIVKEEGLEQRWQRHRNNCLAFIDGINALGLNEFAQEGFLLPPLNTVTIPKDIVDTQVRNTLLHEHSIEIGGGLGALKGKIWRVGLMGLNSTEQNVVLILEALERALKYQSYKVSLGKGVRAAIKYYAHKQ